jgi:hypothetical protein
LEEIISAYERHLILQPTAHEARTFAVHPVETDADRIPTETSERRQCPTPSWRSISPRRRVTPMALGWREMPGCQHGDVVWLGSCLNQQNTNAKALSGSSLGQQGVQALGSAEGPGSGSRHRMIR